MTALSNTKSSGSGPVLDGRFEILSTLGNGAMSVVVSARHLQLRQKVAIKMLRPEFAASSDVVTRFLREARAAASLRNEHVVSVSDVGMLQTGVPYLVMEYLEGTDLSAHLAAHGPLPVDLAVEYVFQVLEALAEAHRAGIVHRDIKPANLLLTHREDGSALIKVLDFGVSKFTGPDYTQHELTRQGPFLGSPAYMSPEQIKNPSEVDVRTDIWSIGVVLYELVTGQLPFPGRNAAELVTSICSSQPTPIAPLISRMPIELVGVIGRCVHKQREQRHANVQELARALLPFARTAAARVSVERVLGMQPGPPPAMPERTLPRCSSIPTVTTDRIVLGTLHQSSRRRMILGAFGGVCLGAAAYIAGPSIGFGRHAGEVGKAGAAAGAPAPLPAACEAPASSVGVSAPASSGPSESACPAPPAPVARAASGQGSGPGTVKRNARPREPSARVEPNPPSEERVQPVPEPASAPAAPYGGYVNPSRPLDSRNPYAVK